MFLIFCMPRFRAKMNFQEHLHRALQGQKQGRFRRASDPRSPPSNGILQAPEILQRLPPHSPPGARRSWSARRASGTKASPPTHSVSLRCAPLAPRAAPPPPAGPRPMAPRHPVGAVLPEAQEYRRRQGIRKERVEGKGNLNTPMDVSCLLYTSPSPRD